MRKVLKLIILLSMLLMTTSFAAIGHIDGCTNTGDPSECCTKTFNITAQAGYRIVDVLVNGVSKGPITSYTFSDITEAQKMEVKTEKIQYTLTVTQVANGTISPSTTSVNYGGSQAFTITPSSGYLIKDVLVNGSSVGKLSSYTFSNVSSNQSISATFEQNLILTIPVGAYISYTPASGTVTALSTDTGADSDQTFTPSEYTSGWRVLYNNDGQLDIISTRSIGDLTLGSKNGDSGSAEEDPERARLAYSKLIYTLNKLCNDYATGSYAVSGRCPGQGDGTDIIPLEDITYSVVEATCSSRGHNLICLPYGDNRNVTELELIRSSLPDTNATNYIWIASRAFSFDDYGVISFQLRSFNSKSSYSSSCVSYDNLYGLSAFNEPYGTYKTLGVRPIIKLQAELRIISGSGTESDPYVLSN